MRGERFSVCVDSPRAFDLEWFLLKPVIQPQSLANPINSFVNALRHSYPFDPAYGHSLADLLLLSAPEPPVDFDAFWQVKRDRALSVRPQPELKEAGMLGQKAKVFDLRFGTTDGLSLGGWLVVPADEAPRRGLIWGHGYGGREGPFEAFPLSDAAVLFPCCRGISRSAQRPYSSDPNWHVLHDIDKPARYVLGSCVEDLWVATTVLLELFPSLLGHIGYLGTSFGGGIGALAAACETRWDRVSLDVPSFGDQARRLQLPTLGSGASVRQKAKTVGEKALLATLSYHDAAFAARKVRVPVLCSCALFDPCVAPPGQFAIYNALPESLRELFVRPAGHFEFPGQDVVERSLLRARRRFFSEL